MKVLVAPDRFGVELAAAEAAEAVALGWARTAPYDELDLLPLSDGGPGFLDVLRPRSAASCGVVTVAGPLGDPVPARAAVDDRPARRTSRWPRQPGCTWSTPERRDPVARLVVRRRRADRRGGRRGAQRIVVGVGGTASTDGGAGLLAALGASRRGAASRRRPARRPDRRST